MAFRKQLRKLFRKPQWSYASCTSCGTLNFVTWKQRKEVVTDLKMLYTAATEVEAEQRLDEFSLKWDAKFPMIANPGAAIGPV
jgi:transposase-like protein